MRTITVNIQSLTRETLHGNVLNVFSTNACINFTHYGKISCKRLYLRCFSITSISSLFDATTVRNVTLQEIREMETGNDLTASPAQTSRSVHPSFVQEEERVRLATARRLHRTLPFQSSSSSENEASFESDKICSSESTGDLTQAEDRPLASAYNKRKQEERDSEEHTASPAFVTMPESGWLVNDQAYMAKVYENIRWR